tara:strand:- start:1178 stop:2431 length:1254 start_codon:yes stop_codon:yes gene_type:complete
MIALIDCNNFYASCERIFRPDLIAKPVIVLSNNDGCVIARSNEVKDMGVSMGTPLFKINDLVRNYEINIFSSNFALYGDISNRIMQILKNDIANVEIYSIDEAFLDFSDFNNYEIIALDLVNKINKWTGIPTSVGIAETKTLTKIANLFAKQSKSKNIFHIDNSKIKFFTQKTKISDVWGIGNKYTKFLNKNKIYTAYDLTQKNDKWILNNMSINGLKTKYELKGIKCFELELLSSPKKNIRTSRTFSKETSDYYKLQRIISSFASKSSEKLRRQNSKTSSITVFIKTNRFKTCNNNFKLISKSNFEYPTDDNSIIVKEALKILNKIFIPGKLYKQAGVIIGDFQLSNTFQPGLFENMCQKTKRNKLMQAFDNINNVFGSESIKLGSEEFYNKWRTNRNKLSPSYTTKWNDILDVNI